MYRVTKQRPQTRGLVNVRKAAEMLGLSHKTLRDWMASRRIGVVHLSTRAVRIPLEEIDRLAEAGMVPALPARPDGTMPALPFHGRARDVLKKKQKPRGAAAATLAAKAAKAAAAKPVDAPSAEMTA